MVTALTLLVDYLAKGLEEQRERLAVGRFGLVVALRPAFYLYQLLGSLARRPGMIAEYGDTAWELVGDIADVEMRVQLKAAMRTVPELAALEPVIA